MSTQEDGTVRSGRFLGSIEFRNVSFRYPKSRLLTIENVSFKINPKDRVALIGSSGSGKTTILKLILGFYEVSGGEILINGVSIKSMDRDYLRSQISIVNQNVKLFNRSVIENIAYGTGYSHSYIIDRIKRLDIMGVFNNLKGNLNMVVGKYGDNLSGGQKQIIYLLRCYFRKNPIIILDEPTSNIDDFHKRYVIRMINEITKDSTLLMVSHDPDVYNMFEKKIIISRGRLDKIVGFKP